MYLLGFSLDNLSLMALTIATGFVVDDAIVVLENISRHLEAGMPRRAGGAARRARGRLHRALDQPVADRGVHADPADGRHRRPAVPRIRDDAVARDPGLAGDLADHDADDVRAVPAADAERAADAAAHACSTARWASMRARSAGRCVTALLVMLVLAGHHRPQRLSVRHRAEGLLPAAGHRPADRRHAGRPEHLVPGDAAEARRRWSTIVQQRSGGRERRRLYRRARWRRRPDQFRSGVRRPEADRRSAAASMR